MTTRIRTRFAPSPTGPLHIGGVRTALYSYLYAKKHGGDFLLRIEDTDTARTVRGSEDLIYESLRWCGIHADEGVEQGGDYGPYKQSERKAIYHDYAQILLKNGKAYYAFDTEEEIAMWRENTAKENNGVSAAYNFSTRYSMRNALTLSESEVRDLLDNGTPYVVRLRVESDDDIRFYDEIRGEVHFQATQLDDRVLLKSDGMPTYHLANVVDDYLMKISHVIRGEEWLASTPHHILLYRAFGWSPPSFSHLPLILKPDGKGKLSKRDGDRLGFPVFCTQWVNPETDEVTTGFREKGFEPDAFVNFIAMLGWNDGTENELFSMEDLIAKFSLDRVHKAGAKFNYEKAIWYNQQYVHRKSIKELAKAVESDIRAVSPLCTDEFIQKYCALYRDRISFEYELKDIGKYLYAGIQEYDIDTLQKKWNESSLSFLDNYISLLGAVDFEDSTALEDFTKLEITQAKNSLGNILPILRIGLTGITKGPSVFDTMVLLGREETIHRLKNLKKIIA